MLTHLQNASDSADVLVSTGLLLAVAAGLLAAGAAITHAITLRKG